MKAPSAPWLPLAAAVLIVAGCGRKTIQPAAAPVPGPTHVFQEPTFDEVVAQGADGSVQQAKSKYGVTLDYKPASVKQVDAILTKLHGEYVKDKGNQRWAIEGLGWGAYVGEVIRRQYGGHWEKQDNATGNPLPLVWRNGTSFPVTWCLGQIISGPSASVWVKYRVLTSPAYTHAVKGVNKA
jgi:hypothetical protein